MSTTRIEKVRLYPIVDWNGSVVDGADGQSLLLHRWFDRRNNKLTCCGFLHSTLSCLRVFESPVELGRRG